MACLSTNSFSGPYYYHFTLAIFYYFIFLSCMVVDESSRGSLLIKLSVITKKSEAENRKQTLPRPHVLEQADQSPVIHFEGIVGADSFHSNGL